MTVTKQVQNINDFVVSFLETIGVDKDAWNAPENMKKFKALFNKTTKKMKDKDKPKRASSAYLFFCKDKRVGVKERLGEGAGTTTVTTELGRMWRALKTDPDHENLMEPYQKLADEDKKRYEVEMKNYVPPTQEEIKKKRKRSRTKGPKRARSAYIFFCTEQRDQAKKNLEGQGADAKAVTAELGRMWREFKESGSKEEMSKYVNMHEEDKKRFNLESESHVPEAPPVKTSKKSTVPPPRRSVVSSSKKKGSSPKKKSASKLLAYRLFVKTTRSVLKREHPEMSAREITSALGKQWKGLTGQSKQQWIDKVTN